MVCSPRLIYSWNQDVVLTSHFWKSEDEINNHDNIRPTKPKLHLFHNNLQFNHKNTSPITSKLKKKQHSPFNAGISCGTTVQPFKVPNHSKLLRASLLGKSHMTSIRVVRIPRTIIFNSQHRKEGCRRPDDFDEY